MADSDKKQKELEPIPKGVCVPAALRKDRDPLANMLKRAREAEARAAQLGVKFLQAQARSAQLQDKLDRVKKENNKLYNEIAQLKQNLES